MGFQTISVKEAVNNINANLNGWFLPAVQRPYVWGSRYESEKYISHIGKYPVINLSLKCGKQPTFEMAFKALSRCIAREYKRHRFINRRRLAKSNNSDITCC